MQIQSHQKVYVVCMNPMCSKQKQRCLTSSTLHKHPQECCHHYFPAQIIKKTDWKNIQNYPSDSLGRAVKQKYTKSNVRSFLAQTIQNLKSKICKSIDELSVKLSQLYPHVQLQEFYKSVYNLDKVGESLRNNNDPTYISNLINSNFMKPKYHALMVLNQNYDDVKIMVDDLYIRMNQHINILLKKHRQYQVVVKTKTAKQLKKINYDLVKSKFISSSQIQFTNGEVVFPKIKNISSFLPWCYTQKYFNSGVHELKITSVRYPLVQNSGFTVLQDQDSDTYPYTHYKSLFNQEGRGFKLIKGEDIQKFIAKSTVITLRLQLGAGAKATLHDSQMKCYYQCQLKQGTNYRMGIYGCGWSIIIMQIN